MPKKKTKNIAKIFEEGTLIDEALAKAVREALRLHKQAGNPVVEWRNGEIVWIPPEEIDVDATTPLKKNAKRRKAPTARIKRRRG